MCRCRLGACKQWLNRYLLRLYFVTTAVSLTACQIAPQLLANKQPLPTLVPTVVLHPQPVQPTEAIATPAATHTATAVLPTETPTNIPPPVETALPGYQLTLNATVPQGYLNQFRLVAFYGSPTGPGLGILGELPRNQMHQQLLSTIATYEPFSDRLILPAYHLVTTVANPHPPYYRHHVKIELIEQWIAEAKALETAVILDIQPGRADLMTEFTRIEYLLYEPHVHLALDPEFVMNESQVPGANIGQLYAHQINEVQARLDAIGAEIGLNRVLILHQFRPAMLPDKAFIADYPHVELLIDGDGVGTPGAKIRNYTTYATEPAFEFGGFKLFPTDGDYPLMSPTEVMNLTPQPVLIIYQ